MPEKTGEKEVGRVDTGVVVPLKYLQQMKDEHRFAIYVDRKNGHVMLSAQSAGGAARLTDAEIKARVAKNRRTLAERKDIRKRIVEKRKEAAKAARKGKEGLPEVERLGNEIAVLETSYASLKTVSVPRRK